MPSFCQSRSKRQAEKDKALDLVWLLASLRCSNADKRFPPVNACTSTVMLMFIFHDVQLSQIHLVQASLVAGGYKLQYVICTLKCVDRRLWNHK